MAPASSAGSLEVWGLTGGIAAGKSMAARYFVKAGIPVLDADQVARELSAPDGLAHEAIIKRFGTIDRAQLRQIVFADPIARSDLEAILHPMIAAESLRRMQAFGVPQVIYEAALLVETGRYQDLAGLIVVDAPRSVRRARLIERDSCDPELADQILDAQIGEEERRSVATVIFTNDGIPEHLQAQVRKFILSHGWRKNW